MTYETVIYSRKLKVKTIYKCERICFYTKLTEITKSSEYYNVNVLYWTEKKINGTDVTKYYK